MLIAASGAFQASTTNATALRMAGASGMISLSHSVMCSGFIFISVSGVTLFSSATRGGVETELASVAAGVIWAETKRASRLPFGAFPCRGGVLWGETKPFTVPVVPLEQLLRVYFGGGTKRGHVVLSLRHAIIYQAPAFTAETPRGRERRVWNAFRISAPSAPPPLPSNVTRLRVPNG